MHPAIGALIAVAALTLTVAQTRASSEIVIAIRYLQAEGTSHSHLYLYRVLFCSDSPHFGLTRLFVRFNHLASTIVNINHSTV